MKWWDALLGRTEPAKPDLDALFALPSAAVTLQAATELAPTGTGSVCFREAEGGAFAELERDVTRLLAAGGGPPVEQSTDTYGYTWLLARRTPEQLGELVTDLHAVNSSLESAGFGPSLLCSLIAFTDLADRKLALVYLYKRGTFYPFAPVSGQHRDNALELQVRAAIEDELPIEPDLGRWFPLWGAPGL
ncbi:PspA-associated protein PspAB [Streptosporangium sp. CA-135522]|uniref:PspA-associated protein PspAB n=1 Tax=Streptosporangium sp. CA-135522 TaxID=3240072 RepID=UPI003D8EDF9E